MKEFAMVTYRIEKIEKKLQNKTKQNKTKQTTEISFNKNNVCILIFILIVCRK